MKKTMLFLIFLCTLTWPVPHYWGKYAPAVQIIEKKYIKNQINYSIKTNTHFTYKYLPVAFFPSFCLPKSALNLKGFDVEYLCDSVSVWKRKQAFDYYRLKIATLSFTGKSKHPLSKTYTLFSFYLDSVSGTWVEDAPPFKIVLALTNKEQGFYGNSGK